MAIPLYKTFWDNADVKAVNHVLQRGTHWSNGPEIPEFESKLAAYMGRSYCTVFNSGTSALHALLYSYGIRPGDEVIVPSFAFVSTAAAPLFVGAKSVFADIEEKTYALEAESVRKKITHRTKAIILMHYAGMPAADTKEIRAIAAENNIILIEDTAESMGALLNGKKAGSFGDAAILSLCANKIISTGEGGAVVTDSIKLAERLKSFCSYGKSAASDALGLKSPYQQLGYNVRLSSMAAALGISQLKKIEKIIKKRRERAKKLSALLDGLPVKTPSENSSRYVYQLYTIELSNHKIRDGLGNYLLKRGIFAKVYFPPLHRSALFQHPHTSLPVTESIAQKVLTLPMYPSLSDKECIFIADTVKRYFAKNI